MHTIWQDLRYGVQMLAKNPGFTAIAVLTLALGVGANTALFSVVDAVLLKKLPVKDPDSLVLFSSIATREFSPGSHTGSTSRDPITGLMLSSSSNTSTFYFPGAKAGADGRLLPSGNVYIHYVRENFLEAMQIPLLTGRSLTTHDNAHAARVAIVNQTFAKRFLPDENVIGKRFGLEGDKTSDVEIVGLARDAKYTSQRDETPPTIYLSWLQELRVVGSVTFEVRTTGNPDSFIAGIRQAVRDVDGNLPLKEVKTQIEQADETLAMERLFAKLLSLFGLLAQQLASIGLYGVLAWAVSRRTHEIGIRMALGADRRKVLKMILRQGMTLTLIGVALGLAGAYVLTKYLESLTTMLYGVQPRDPLTYGLTAALLTLIALIACLVPARRATNVDPMIALRYE
jgi:predicted permease